MNISYYFDENGDNFDYEVSVNDFLKDKCSPERLVEIARQYWKEGMPEEDKKEFTDIHDIDNDELSPSNVADILANADDWIEEELEEEIKDAYEDEASDAYIESQAFNKNPYGYYGVSSHDFY